MENYDNDIKHALEVAALLLKLNEGHTLSDDEAELLRQSDIDSPEMEAARARIADRKYIVGELRAMSEYDVEEQTSQVFEKLGLSLPVRRRGVRPFIRWMSAAAAIILICATTWIWINYQRRNGQATKVSNVRADQAAIAPGGNKAILILGNGHRLTLDSISDGAIATQGNTAIEKANGRLIYEGTDKASVFYNTIEVPRGGQYALQLGDGTKVWLNASSTLTYPTSFDTSRVVELKGEGYFEVSQDRRRPFKVKVNGMEVQVLGTAFNVKAYEDEDVVKTTLVGGAVQLSAPGLKSVRLRPGDQGMLTAGHPDLKVRQVNVDNEIAWKNGYFSFDDRDIYDIMRSISRWYDVDIHFSESYVGNQFGGTVQKYKSIEEVLHVLELTGTIHFKIKDRVVTVTP